jgi:hypothetical protein
VFRHCIHCTRDLGTNEAIERLPIGRRVAFDPRRGRLWVVCGACARWNLVPFEERWEALEACERAFRATRLRRSTDHVGLARVADGVELVRIGEPVRPELAAWRYAADFRGRYLRAQASRAAEVAAIAGMTIATATPAFLGVFGDVRADPEVRTPYSLWLDRWRRGAVVRDPGDGTPLVVSRIALARACLLPDEDDGTRVALELETPRRGLARLRAPDHRVVTLRGDDATSLLRQALPVINRRTGRASTVEAALAELDAAGDPTRLMRRLAERRDGADDPVELDLGDHVVFTLAPARRLALEMALHEEDERRWLDGELHELERHWREAEAVAAIADRLLVPATVAARAAAMRETDARRGAR